MIDQFSISTKKRYQLVDITQQVEDVISKSKIEDGTCLVFVPHSTAAILLTENEEGLKRDFLAIFKKIAKGHDFDHDQIDDNADSHILSAILGQGKTLPIGNGRLIRGTWQQIFLVELDGPRERTVVIKVVSSS